MSEAKTDPIANIGYLVDRVDEICGSREGMIPLVRGIRGNLELIKNLRANDADRVATAQADTESLHDELEALRSEVLELRADVRRGERVIRAQSRLIPSAMMNPVSMRESIREYHAAWNDWAFEAAEDETIPDPADYRDNRIVEKVIKTLGGNYKVGGGDKP